MKKTKGGRATFNLEVHHALREKLRNMERYGVKSFLNIFSEIEEVVQPIRLRKEDYRKPLTIQSCCGRHPAFDS